MHCVFLLRIISCVNSARSLKTIGTLRNHEGNGNIRKYKFALLVLLSDYSNSFNLYNVAELFSNRTGGKGVQVETENGKFTVMCSRSPQNLEFGHFTLLFGRARWRNLPKFLTHVQGLCFFSLNHIVLWRSRYRRRSSFLNFLVCSLIPKPSQ